METDPQSIAADPETSAFVTANAGSGKTTTLVNRVARLLLRGVRPETILCVTYTKAAAAEMQRRLFETLGEWALMDDAELRERLVRLEGARGEDADTARARTLFAKALETPGGLKIQTIHAFCEKLLRRFPIEADVSPGFTVLDDVAAAQVVGEARDGVARRALAGEPLLAQAYARFSVALDFAVFEGMFAAFEARREAIAAYVTRCGGLAGTPQAVAEACGLPHMRDAGAIEAEAVAPPALSLPLWREAAGVLRGGSATDQKRMLAMAEVAEHAAQGVADLKAALRVFCNKDGSVSTWLVKAVVLRPHPALQARLMDERDRLMEADALAKAARVAQDTVQMLILAAFYADAYEAAKRARGVLDFTDLVSKTAQLLTGQDAAAWVLYKLDAGLEHILVDEAQDTAPDQWAIVDALTEEFYAGAGSAFSERRLERALFVVGDEKQSIFSFQGAAPERLLSQRELYRARALAAARRFEVVPLHESWRSAPEVLAFVDAVFVDEGLRRALQPKRGGEDVAADLIRHIAKRSADLGTIDLWPLEREEPGEERGAWDEPLDAREGHGAYRRLADRIAGEIKALTARGDAVYHKGQLRPAGYGDVLILVRKRKVLFEELLRACKRHGVPVAGADRLALSEHPVFEDFLALARFCLFPDDDLTLAALLRSPFCDVDEQGLFDLAHGRGKASLWAALARRGDERPAWAAARGFLGWARGEASSRTPFDFYGRVLTRLDGAGRSTAQRIATRLGPEAGDAVEAFLAQALAAERRGTYDLERFADGLARLNVTVKREMDEPRGEVRIMTAHGAKGLEAPIVFLPETVSAPGGRASPLLETEDGGFLWCGSSAGDCEASSAARAWRRRREDEEALRLLYVALTRARDRLVVAGRINAKGKEENVSGWWRPLCAAFDRLGDQVRALDGGVRRFGADPQQASSSDEARQREDPRTQQPGSSSLLGPRVSAALRPRMTEALDWASRAPPPEPAAAAYAAPSTLLEDARGASPSPLARAGGLGRFRRGNLIHRLLQLLPDLPPAERAQGAARLLAKEPDLTAAQAAEMAAAALGVLADPAFAEVFAPGSRAEAAVAGTAPDLPDGLAVAGRVDRLRVAPDRVLVVDFKTNRPAPATIAQADPAYLLQMAVYTAVLKAVFPGRRVEAALVWTDGPRLMPVPEAVMRDALSRMGRSS